jgi:solute carrier family 25 (peroxisomal adenine nucleotide transporter), member 17
MSSPIADAVRASTGGLFALCMLYPLDLLRTKRAAETSYDSKKKEREDDGAIGKKQSSKSSSSSHHRNAPSSARIRGQVTDRNSSNIWQDFALIVNNNGVAELYRGLYSRALHCLFSDLVYYYTYASLVNRKLSSLKSIDGGGRGTGGIVNVSQSVQLGILAGIVTNVLTIPVDTVSMNLQISESEKRMGIWELAWKIYKEYGILRFWKGLLPACMLTINPAMNMALFEHAKAWYVFKKRDIKYQSSGAQLSAFEAFILGTVSKGAATVVTYPMIRLKTLLLKVSEEYEEEDSSAVDVIRLVLKNEGVAGFYRGMYVQLLRSASGSGLMFMVREALR